MKIYVIGKQKKEVEKLKRIIKELNYELNDKYPDIVLSFGGDGSLFIAERLYPGIPKLPVRDKSLCLLCNRLKLKNIIDKLLLDKFSITENNKIEGIIKKKNKSIRLIGMNDIVIRNNEPYHAIRFKVKVNKKMFFKLPEEIIGDGIVASTALGSTGYFHSITRKKFKKGIGIAFNNPTQKIKPIKGKNLKAVFKLIRNTAEVSVDNNEKTYVMNKGDKIVIRESKEKYRIVKI
ncbi:NAD(+)/NADH kinase [Candidatus Pacearchaeota archaeon]|nr:NAD(+)/NADH kinase [Candidatus Pacearchaeota archaeon]